MKKRIILPLILTVLLLAAGLTAFLLLSGGKHEGDLLLHLTFNEGKGTTVSDASGRLPDVDMSYMFSHAVFMEDQEPQWRAAGVNGGSLLFDGTSTYVTYKRNDIQVSGEEFTVSAWVAPRTFEWDDPNASINGNDTLTGIVSQNSRGDREGFILGYGRHGQLSFQAGTGDDWLSVWTNGDNLQKYAWNHVVGTFSSKRGEMCLYLNGELVASCGVDKGAAIAPASKTLLIGRNGEGERLTAGFRNVHSGLMDEVKLYAYAFTADEIAGLYKKTEVPEIAFEDIWLQNILTGDYTRPQYHGAPYQFWMNEPHAPLYYNGKYHLFFQQNMSGSYWRNICWGHLVSDDMVNWVPVKEAIVPMADSVVPDGVWSGCAATDVNGVPLLFFTAGNDSFRDAGNLISNQNIGVAYPADLSDPNLTEWIVLDELTLVQKPNQGRTGEFRDPMIWQDETGWNMLICSGSVGTGKKGGTALLYRSAILELKDGRLLADWQYMGPIYEMPNQSGLYGTSWELPILLPVIDEAGTKSTWMFVFSPAPASSADNKIYYFLGDFNKETGKFTPDDSFGGIPRMLDYGSNVFTGPSALVDPVSGDIVMFSIMQDQRSAADQGASGWAHTVGLARKIWLNDEGTDLCIAPIDAIATLEDKVLIDGKDMTVTDANAALSAINEDMLHLRLKVRPQDEASFGLNLKVGGKWDITTYTYDPAKSMLTGETASKGAGAKTNITTGDVSLVDGCLTMDIYIDRSLIEGFFNEEKALTIRAYPEDAASQGMSVFANGDIVIEELYVATMKPITK